nr:MAG TPA: hypothetical protein [Caudoviricetes sp.]
MLLVLHGSVLLPADWQFPSPRHGSARCSSAERNTGNPGSADARGRPRSHCPCTGSSESAAPLSCRLLASAVRPFLAGIRHLLMAAAHLCQTLLRFFAVAGLSALHHVAQIGVFAHLVRRPNARIVPVLQERQHIRHRGLRARRGGAPDGFTQHRQRHMQHIRRSRQPLHLRWGGNRTEIRPPDGSNLLIARARPYTRVPLRCIPHPLLLGNPFSLFGILFPYSLVLCYRSESAAVHCIFSNSSWKAVERKHS